PGGDRRGREVRGRLSFLRRAWAAVRRRSGRRRRRPSFVRGLRATWRRAGRDAVELPLLAGDPLRRARAGGGQRRLAEARVQRAGMRARAAIAGRTRWCPGG